MRVMQLADHSEVYTSNVYLVLGDWNRIDDANALVDVGRDPLVVTRIECSHTGLGKRKIDRVVLTHSHYDHTELLPQIRAAFNPEICAFANTLDGSGRILLAGERVRLGDADFEVIPMPGHSADSICLFDEVSGTLFCGDAPVLIHSAGGTYEAGFVRALERLCTRNIKIMYFGHGSPLAGDCNERLRASLQLIHSRYPGQIDALHTNTQAIGKGNTR